jgi:predicted naringenin-chalcone synthase
MYLPGLDTELMRSLGIACDAVRVPLSFVGCAAGLRAIGIAKQLTERGDAGAKALVVCVELCTLHVQLSEERSELLAAALFGDGASACIIGGPSSADGGRKRGIFELGACRSVLLPEGEIDMTWDIGDTGYELHLSPRIPELLSRFLPDELAQLEERAAGDGMPAERKPQLRMESLHGLWAIHPGGRGILDAVQRLYGLSDEQLRPSRDVLRRCGNMSSATILFVLEELRTELESASSTSCRGTIQDGSAGTDPGCGCPAARPGIALAFGPGLTADLQQFAYVPPLGSSLGSKGASLCGDAF